MSNEVWEALLRVKDALDESARAHARDRRRR